MIHIFASGVLLSSPQSRTSSKGADYVTGALRSSDKQGDTVVSLIAFSESAQAEWLSLQAGDGLAVAGVGKLASWTGKDGAERHGLSVMVEKIMTHQPNTKSADGRTIKAPPKPAPRPAPVEQAAPEFSDEIPF